MIWGGAEAVMLALGSGCKYRWSLAERFDCTETIINQLLADSYQNPISEWQVKTSSGLPLSLHYGELYNYFIIHYNVIIIEIKCTMNVIRLNHPQTIPTTPPPVRGKIVFHKTGPWCQKDWRPLLSRSSRSPLPLWIRCRNRNFLPSRAVDLLLLTMWPTGFPEANTGNYLNVILKLKVRQAGTWDPLLQCCNACTWTNVSLSNKIQRNHKGLKITACMCSWGKFWTARYKETKKPNCHFWRARGKSRVLHTPPVHNTTDGVGKTPKPPSGPTPGHTPTLTPCKEPTCPPPPPPPQGPSKQENLLFVLTPLCCSRGPNTALTEFLVWSLINFCLLKSPRTLVGNKSIDILEYVYYKCPWIWSWGNLLGKILRTWHNASLRNAKKKWVTFCLKQNWAVLYPNLPSIHLSILWIPFFPFPSTSNQFSSSILQFSPL